MKSTERLEAFYDLMFTMTARLLGMELYILARGSSPWSSICATIMTYVSVGSGVKQFYETTQKR